MENKKRNKVPIAKFFTILKKFSHTKFSGYFFINCSSFIYLPFYFLFKIW